MMHTNSKHFSSARLLLALLLLSLIGIGAGCAKKDLPKLPPAAGEGAPAPSKTLVTNLMSMLSKPKAA